MNSEKCGGLSHLQANLFILHIEKSERGRSPTIRNLQIWESDLLTLNSVRSLFTALWKECNLEVNILGPGVGLLDVESWLLAT